MKHLDLRKEGSVFVLTMIDGENKNTLSTGALKEYNEVFDEIENTKGNAALLLTSNDPKMWCNGINMQWYAKQSKEERDDFLQEMKRTLLRASLLNLPTIGCLTGHCYAGGTILACSMDFRYMRSDRGRFCLPEVNFAMPLGDTLYGIINSLPSKSAVQELVLSGVALGGEECFEKNVVNGIYPEEELFDKTLEFAREMAGKVRDNYIGLKNDVKKNLKEMWDSGSIK